MYNKYFLKIANNQFVDKYNQINGLTKKKLFVPLITTEIH